MARAATPRPHLRPRRRARIVDQLALDPFDAADARRAHRRRAARSRPPRPPSRGVVVHPRERIEHAEEKHERRDEQPLPRRRAVQLDHQRDESRVLVRRVATSRASVSGVVLHVGVGKPPVLRRAHRPRAPRRCPPPAPIPCRSSRRDAARPDHVARVPPRQPRDHAARDCARAVVAAIVDHRDREPPRIALRQHRSQVRPMTSASLRAGTTACTSGAGSPAAGREAIGTRVPKASASDDQPDPRRRAHPRRARRFWQHVSIDIAPSPALGPPADLFRSRAAIARAVDALFRNSSPAGYWWAELQSNVSITAEVLLLHHVWGTFDRVPHARPSVFPPRAARARRLGTRLRRRRRTQRHASRPISRCGCSASRPTIRRCFARARSSSRAAESHTPASSPRCTSR